MSADTPSPDLPPELRSAFRIVRMLGSGAMGNVYEAKQMSLGRRVALKLMKPGPFHDSEAARRFQEEARILSRLSHPNVVRLFDGGVVSGVPYLVIEYVEGVTWSEHVHERALPVQETLALAMRLLDGLEYLHSHGVIHRDLKPDNVFVLDGRDVKVIDFGLARALDRAAALTKEGFAVGTPVFMSPEQILGGAPSTGWDLYAAGVILYRTLSGKYPFPVRNTQALIERKLAADPDPLPGEFPAPLREAVARCLTRDERRRIRTCGELRELLSPVAPGSRPARPAARVMTASRPRQTQAWKRFLPGVAALMALGALVAVGWRMQETPVAEPVAAQAKAPAPKPPDPREASRTLSEFREALRSLDLDRLRLKTYHFAAAKRDPKKEAVLFESLLSKIDYRPRLARAEAIAQSPAAVTMPLKGLQSLLASARELRRLDLFCEAEGIPFRSGIERLDRPIQRVSVEPQLPATGVLELNVPLGGQTSFQSSGIHQWELFSTEPVTEGRYQFVLPPGRYGPVAELAVCSRDLHPGAAFEVTMCPGAGQSYLFVCQPSRARRDWLYHSFESRSLSPGTNAIYLKFTAPSMKLTALKASLEKLVVRVVALGAK